jgi:hypothetical protein
VPPDPDRAAGSCHVNDLAALSDLDVPLSGQPVGGRSDVVHELSPTVRPRRAGCGTATPTNAWPPLDFITGYVGGRAKSLGEASPPVVAATFAWFEPNLLAGWYEAARSTVPRDRLMAVRDTATASSLAEVLAGDDPTSIADLLAGAAAGADGTGRPLFSGLRGRGRPDDPFQRLW